MKKPIRHCDVCGVADSKEHPRFEILNVEGEIEQLICMDCFVKEIEEQEDGKRTI